MKGTAKRKVVTSGRLTGGVKVQPARRRVTPNPGPAACPEPAYSLYSTDSEDQVTTLHKGLDRCAALLSGILQTENAEPKPSPIRAVKGGATKSRISLGKKSCKKPPIKTDVKSSQSVYRGAGRTTPRSPRSPHVFSSPAAHSGVTLHPPKKHPHTPLQSPSQSHTRQLPSPSPSQPHTSICPPQPQTSVLLSVSQSNSVPQSSSPSNQRPADREQEESVPVRDTDTQSSGTDPHTGVKDTHSHIHTCTMKMSKLQLEPGQTDQTPLDTHSGDKEVKQRTVQYLLGELKSLIAGQGSVAERLLSHLEQTVSSPLMNVSSSNSPAESLTDLQSLHIQNSQLRRRVKILNQQLKEREKAERQHNVETLCDSQVTTLQEELTSAQSRLQDLQEDLAELRKALQDTQSQLRDREAENTLMKTDLEATRCRLLHSEREKSELASLVQQRLEEIENLNRILQQRCDSSDRHTLVNSSVSDAPPTKHCNQHQHRLDPPEPPTDRITQYLMSLDQLEPTHPDGSVREAAERENDAAGERETSSHPDRKSQRLGPDEEQTCGRQQPGKERRRLFDSTLSHCDVESVTSEWSVRSGSTFDTRDEAAFRDGLAALDASIASLQKTIKLDLGR